MLLRGYSRVLVRTLWWNIFHLAVVAVLVALLVSGQGRELLAITTAHESDLVALIVGVGVPSALFVFVVTTSGFVVGRSGEWQMQALAEQYGIDITLALEISQIYVPLAIGLVPFAVIGLVKSNPFWLGIGFLVALGAFSLLVWQRRRINLAGGLRVPRRLLGRFRLRYVIAGFLLAAFAANLAMVVWPQIARYVETLGVAMIALGAWSAVLSFVFVAVPIHFKLPSFAVAVPLVWLIASMVSDPNLFPRRVAAEAADTADSHRTRVTPPSDVRAFARWISALPVDESNAPFPVFFVSAEGGGLRAAYWSARVLGELNLKTDGRFSRHVFAYSGVSGGSLGVVAFQGAASNGGAEPAKVVADLEAFLGRDYLSPLVSHLLITEPCWQFVGALCGVAPRDVAFERQLAADWSDVFREGRLDRPFAEVFGAKSAEPMPAMLLNATNVETGKRFVLANVRTSNESEVYFPFCGECPLSRVAETLSDVTVAEAVHLSARFPYLSPPASVVTMVRDVKKDRYVRRVWGRVVDGGYFDNSGAESISDLLDDLAILRSSVERPNWQAPPDADIDWARVASRIPRAIFIVLVIRNDPLSTSATDQSLIPTATTRRRRILENVDPVDELGKGELALVLPKGIAASEVAGPPDALLAARDARGLASRKALERFIKRTSLAQIDQCAGESSRSDAGPASARCLERADRYFQVSLAEEIIRAEHEPGHLQESTVCVDVDVSDNVALGWVLSPAVRRSMACLASTSSIVPVAVGMFAPHAGSR